MRGFDPSVTTDSSKHTGSRVNTIGSATSHSMITDQIGQQTTQTEKSDTHKQRARGINGIAVTRCEISKYDDSRACFDYSLLLGSSLLTLWILILSSHLPRWDMLAIYRWTHQLYMIEIP